MTSLRSRAVDPTGHDGIRSTLLLALAVGAAYYGSAWLSLRLALIGDQISPVWPPTGIALFGLLLWGPRVIPGILAGALLTNLPLGPSVFGVAIIAAGNTAAPVTAFVMLRWTGFHRDMDRTRDVVILAGLGALTSMTISATTGTLVLHGADSLSDPGFWAAWSVWWTGDAMGVLVVCPLLLSMVRRNPPEWTRGRRWEFLALLASAALVSSFALRSSAEIEFAVFPILAWGAWRFGQRGATAAVALASFSAVLAVGSGSGLFAHQSLLEAMASLQIFNASAACGSLWLAALVEDRTRSQRALERVAEHLEEGVQRTTAELGMTTHQLGEAQKIAQIGSWDWDVTNDTVTWSRQLYVIFGVEPFAFEAIYQDYLRRIHPEDRARVDEVIREALRDGTPFDFEHRIIRSDGVERWVHSRGNVIRDHTGEPIRMSGTAQDISDVRALSIARDRSISELERSNEELQDFAYIAAHDLQAPLRTIRTLAESVRELLGARPDTEIESLVHKIDEGANRLHDIVTAQLAFARAGAAETLRQNVRLDRVVERALAALQEAVTASGGDVSVDKLPTVQADPTQLVQVFQNLIGNALKFNSPHRKPRIAIRAEPHDGGWLVSVADNGIGLNSRFAESIFQPFKRLHGRDAYPGTGMGLAICQRIIERHGGRIWAESEHGEGTTFHFTLPGASKRATT